MFYLVDNRNNSDPFINLAIEDHLLRFSDKTFLFVYINSPSVIVGRNQNIYEEVNVKFASDNDIKIVRRISGGGAVYHDKGNLSYSIISDYKRELYNNYKKFSQPAILLLQKLNLNAALNERNDIVLNGKKISGVAQFTSRNRMITHGTLLFNTQLSTLRRVLEVKQDEFVSKSTKSKRSSVINIADELQKEISVDEFKDMLIEEFSDFYGGIAEFNFGDDEWFKVKESAKEKFKNWNWIYERIPKFQINRRRIIGEKSYTLFMKVDKGIISEIELNSEGNYTELNFLKKSLIGKKYFYDEIRNLLEENQAFQDRMDLLQILF